MSVERSAVVQVGVQGKVKSINHIILISFSQKPINPALGQRRYPFTAFQGGLYGSTSHAEVTDDLGGDGWTTPVNVVESTVSAVKRYTYSTTKKEVLIRIIGFTPSAAMVLMYGYENLI